MDGSLSFLPCLDVDSDDEEDDDIGAEEDEDDEANVYENREAEPERKLKVRITFFKATCI